MTTKLGGPQYTAKLADGHIVELLGYDITPPQDGEIILVAEYMVDESEIRSVEISVHAYTNEYGGADNRSLEQSAEQAIEYIKHHIQFYQSDEGQKNINGSNINNFFDRHYTKM